MPLKIPKDANQNYGGASKDNPMQTHDVHCLCGGAGDVPPHWELSQINSIIDEVMAGCLGNRPQRPRCRHYGQFVGRDQPPTNFAIQKFLNVLLKFEKIIVETFSTLYVPCPVFVVLYTWLFAHRFTFHFSCSIY